MQGIDILKFINQQIPAVYRFPFLFLSGLFPMLQRPDQKIIIIKQILFL